MSFRFAIMGAGKIAVKFADAVRRIDGCEITAVGSKSKERAAAFAAVNGIPHSYGNYEELLQREKPDCVYIATTPDSHYRLARLCMDYRTPILCEKAMFENSRDASEIFADSAKYGVFVMEATWSRFLPANRMAKQWLSEGRIGKPACMQCVLCSAFDRSRDLRNFDPKLGGGAAFDLTVYTYELADFYFGQESERQVFATWDAYGADITNLVSLKYGDGERLASLLSCCEGASDQRVEISGSRGRIVIPHAHSARDAVLYADGKEEHFQDTETANGFVYEIQEAVRCIRAGMTESPVVPHSLTLRCAEVFDEIYSRRP